MTKKINSPNDLFFKLTLTSPQAIKDFFQAHIPSHLRKYIDITSIKPAIASHVLPSLKQLHNDLIFSCQVDQNIGFILVEQQSKPDWNLPLRYLKYDMAVISQYLKDKKAGTPWPFLLNLCVYAGDINQPYPYPEDVYDYFANGHLAQEIGIAIKFHLSNLSTTPDPILENHGTVGLLEKLIKYRMEKNLFDILSQELDRCRDWILGIDMDAAPLGEDYWETILYYTTNFLDPARHSEEELVALFVDKLFKTKQEVMRTIARQIEKRGEIKGMQQGIQQGMQQEKLAIAKSMLKKELAISLIQEVTGLSKKTIEQLKNA